MENDKKPWESYFYVSQVFYQKDWGDHPSTGDWTQAYTVFCKETREPVTVRRYKLLQDAKRGAAQIYNKIEKTLLNDNF